MPLTGSACKNARPEAKPKRLAFRVYPTVSLKEARAKRDEAKQQLREKPDPGATKLTAKVHALIPIPLAPSRRNG